jgi:hypothetical protein
MWPEFLASQSDRRCVDQGLHFVDVVAQYAEEQRFVAVVQSVERDEFFQWIGQQAQSRQHALSLLVLGMHARGQKAAQIELVSLRFGKSGAPVEGGVAQQREAGERLLQTVCVGFFVHDGQFRCLVLSLFPTRIASRVCTASLHRRSMQWCALAIQSAMVFELSALRLIWINKAKRRGR